MTANCIKAGYAKSELGDGCSSLEVELLEEIEIFKAQNNCIQANHDLLKLRLAAMERKYKSAHQQILRKSREIHHLQKTVKILTEENAALEMNMEDIRERASENENDHLITIADLQQKLDWALNERE